MAQPSSSGVETPSKSIVQSIDNLARRPNVVEPPSKSVVEALNKLAGRIESFRSLADLAAGPHERILALRAEGTRKLHGPVPPTKDSLWYYELSGSLTDLTGEIPGTGKLESVFSWFPEEVGAVVLAFPEASLAGPPFNAPPEHGFRGVETNAEALGHTKTRLTFPDGSTIVSFGVNQTKIKPYSDRSAQLFETNTEVIITGSGKFEGAKGLITSDLGAYFNPLVKLDPTQEPYKSGFPVKVFIFIRLTTK